MSGSGGGGGRVSNGSGTPDDCGSLVIDTVLNSPVAAVVKNLQPNDELDVEIQISTSATQVKELVAKTSGGKVAGSLTPPSLITIITCIEKGFKYVAIVQGNVVGGLVKVRIQGKQ